MFSLQIVDSDAFLDMPQSTQLLYFHLSMRADDEGFVGNPKKIMRMIGTSEDDMKVLLAKRFILSFQSGVVVIKHWLIHNTIRMDRFNPTAYEKEKKLIITKENKAYTELATNRQPNDNQLATQVKLSKVKLSKVKLSKSSIKANSHEFADKINGLIKLFELVNPNFTELYANTTQRNALLWLIKKHGPPKMEEVIKALPHIMYEHPDKKYAPTITTPLQLKNKLANLVAFVKQRGVAKSQVAPAFNEIKNI